MDNNTLYCFYDLVESPTSFDIIAFLCLAELHRIENNLTGVHIVFPPGPFNGFKNDILTAEINNYRLRNLLIPCCWLVNTCVGVSVFNTRKEAEALAKTCVHRFPTNYDLNAPKENYAFQHITDILDARKTLPSISVGQESKRQITNWLNQATDKKPIVINLRERDYQEKRNNDMQAWSQFLNYLNKDIYAPIIIRDSEKNLTPIHELFKNYIIFPESYSVDLRAALFELSYLNLFVNNGTAYLSIFNHRSRYLMFKILVADYGVTTPNFFHRQGISVGDQPRFVLPWQRWVWEEDSFENIKNNFESMCEKIEGGNYQKIEITPPIKPQPVAVITRVEEPKRRVIDQAKNLTIDRIRQIQRSRNIRRP